MNGRNPRAKEGDSVRTNRLVPLAAWLAIAGASACQQPDDSARDTLAGATTAADTGASCLPIVPDVRGTLVGQRELGQREARRVRVVLAEGLARIDVTAARPIKPAAGFGKAEHHEQDADAGGRHRPSARRSEQHRRRRGKQIDSAADHIVDRQGDDFPARNHA